MSTNRQSVSFFQTMRVEEAYCETHGVYEQSVNHLGIGSPCPFCTEEREYKMAEKKRAEALEWERENRNQLLRFCRVEPEHYSATLENYAPQNETQQRALDLVKALVSEYKERGEEYVSPKHGKLIISGHNGLGKTHLGAVAVKALRGQIWTMFEISAHIRSGYERKSTKTEWEIIEELTRLPLRRLMRSGAARARRLR